MSKQDCIIFDKVLSDDLYPYDIHNDSIIWYNEQATQIIGQSKISIKQNALDEMIQATSITTENVWHPVIVQKYTDYDYISDYGERFINSRLGIDLFLTIDAPKFKSINTNGKLSADWILNNHTFPYRPILGILCWAMKRPSADKTAKTIENFPVGSKLVINNNCNTVYIKLNNDQLLIEGSTGYDFTNNQWSFTDSSNFIVNVSDLGSSVGNTKVADQKFTLAECYSGVSKLKKILLHEIIPTYDLWISDGDCFLYDDSSQGLNLPISPGSCMSYISGSLYNPYTAIYRMLTLDLKRQTNPKNLFLARKYKNLAKILSSSPFIRQSDIYNLDDSAIANIVRSITNDPSGLLSAAIAIANILHTKSGRNSGSEAWESADIISTKSQLNKKLINKYGINLIATGSTFISTKNDVLDVNNYGIAMQQATEIYSQSNNPSAVQSIRYDNNLMIQPVFTDTVSSLSIKFGGIESALNDEKPIPLFNKAKPPFMNINDSHYISPSLVYKGNVNRIYRNDETTFYPETIGLRNDYIYEAELTVDPNSMIDTPFAAQASLLNIELQAVFIDFANLNLYTDTPMFNPDDFILSQCQFSWKKIAGPDGYFSKPDDPRSSNTGDDGIMPVRGVTNNVLFKTSFTGFFIFECEVKCPIGIFKLKKSIYVVDGRQRLPEANIFKPNSAYRKYWEPNSKQWLSIPMQDEDKIPENFIALPKGTVNANIFVFNNIAIDHKSGIFFPIKTNSFVMEQIGEFNNIPDDQVYSLSSNYLFQYRRANSPQYAYNAKSELLISCVSNEGTYFKINKLILSKIRSNLPNCQNCLSLYNPNLRSRRRTTVLPGGQLSEAAQTVDNISTERTNKYPSQFILTDYRLLVFFFPKLYNRYRISYPRISTVNAPIIKHYGGYNKDIIKSIGIHDDINGLKTPVSYTISSKSLPIEEIQNDLGGALNDILPDISGHKLNYINDKDSSSYKVCYQRIKDTKPTGIIFNKGVLDPNAGWIDSKRSLYSPRANRSAVLKFNPGARDTFSFIGPSFREVDRNVTRGSEGNIIIPTEYNSSIVLGISDHIQWDPVCSCESVSGLIEQNYKDNLLHKDYIDIKYNTTYFSGSNHGYRILAGGEPKDAERTALNSLSIVNDEFDATQSANVFTYKFAVTGPYEAYRSIRTPRVNDFAIKDIEIKLNFLNYINMQDIIILLEVEYDQTETKRRFNDKNQTSPLFTETNYFVNQQIPQNIIGTAAIGSSVTLFNTPASERAVLLESYKAKWKSLFKDKIHLIGADDTDYGLKKYIDTLNNMNTTNISQNKLSLVLWNQQHLQNNTSNISLRFSDHAPLNNVSCDQNMYNHINASNLPVSYFLNDYQQKQHIISNNDVLFPTYMTMNFSDREACFYSNIIKNNRLYLENNSLTKFVSSSLFRNPAPETGPCPESGPKQQGDDYNGTTKFTLKFIVMDEPDIMYPYDNTNLNNYHSGLETTENTIKSTQIFNSLCNWELILHTSNTRKRAPYTTHNLSSYGNSDILSLIDYHNGLLYPGYSYIADLRYHKKFLPLMNYNAPYNIIQDTTTCLTGIDDPSGQGIAIRSPDFPSWAIVAILASIAAYGGLTGGTVVGAISALPLALNNQAYQAIFDWFSSNVITAGLEDQGRQIFAPLYHKYPFGSPEKILLNFRKPGELWYTAEAFISKYHNTPILQNTLYNFIKINPKSSSLESLGAVFDFEVVTSYEELIDEKFIVPVNAKSSCDDILKDKPEYEGHIIKYENLGKDCLEKNSKYYIYSANKEYTLDKRTPKLNSENFNNIIYAYHYMTMNSIASFSEDVQENHIFKSYQDILNKKIIKIKGRFLYDVLRKNDVVSIPYNSDNSIKMSTNTIKNISLIYLDNEYYSVILLENSVINGAIGKIGIDSSVNILFVFKPGLTHYDTKNIKPNDKWGIVNHEFKHNYYTDIRRTATPKAAYGDGSPFVNKNLLSNNQINNKILNISESFNNRSNHRVKMDTIFIRDNSGTLLNKDYNGSYTGFTYSLSEISNISNLFLSNKDKNSKLPAINSLTLEQQIALSIAISAEYSTELFFIRLEQPLNLQESAGLLELITDQTEIIPEKDLTAQQVTLLNNRLNLIANNKINKSLEALVGNTNYTTAILNSNSIKYIQAHLKELNSNDPNKILTYDKLNALIAEKQSILEVLKKKTLNKITVTYQDQDTNQKTTLSGDILYETNDGYVIKSTGKDGQPEIKFVNKQNILTDSNGDPAIQLAYVINESNPKDQILPKYEYEIKTNSDTSLTINYKKINTEHYWINLDPKQSCVLDFATNPKILIATEYTCIPANRVAMRTQDINNNVCPEFLTNGNKAPRQSATNVKEEFFTRTVGDPDNPQSSVTSYVYRIKEEIVKQQAEQYEKEFANILGWKPFVKERYFNINGDEVIGELTDINGDITIRSTETYFVPMSIQDFPDYAQSDLSADTIEVPGIDKCQNIRDHEGSPAGKGLIGFVGGETKRVGGPSRIENVVNLNNQNSIEVNFKNIPRGLRPCDSLATIYRYGPKDIYRPNSNTVPKVPYEIDLLTVNGSINNSLYEWIAMQVDPNSKTLEYTTLPDFFVHQNEMFFRGLYGSIDEIEHKTDVVKSQYAFEMIPYEYE